MCGGCQATGAGIEGAAVREKQDLIERLIQLRAVMQAKSMIRQQTYSTPNIPGLMNRGDDNRRVLFIMSKAV